MSHSSAATARGATSASAGCDTVVRHALVDRIGHWLMAACVLTLLATSFLPILGIQFPWVTIHWATGLVLTVAVVAHTVRSVVWKSVRSVCLGTADARDVMSVVNYNLRRHLAPPQKPGKYSPAQKLIHHGFAITVVTTIVTGILMMLKVDTPFWQRDAGIFANATWGVIHVFHGLAALLLITMVMAHVYFALRPEKLLYLRAMWRGWITRSEYRAHHDPQRWQVDE